MDASFWLKLAISFIIGSLWVTLTTLSAERFGSKVGGLIGGLPSTVVIALFFIGLTQSPEVAAQATTVMPLAQGLNGLFVITFMLLIPHGLLISLVGSLLAWIIQSSLLYLLDLQQFWISLVGWIALFLLCVILVEKGMKIKSQKGVRVTTPRTQLIWRALFGGAVISLAVWMGKVGGSLLGGIFSSFPAMFLSTLVITYLANGAAFSRSVGKSLLVSGLINVPVYEIAVRTLYPSVGLGWGTLIAIFTVLVSGSLTYHFMRANMM